MTLSLRNISVHNCGKAAVYMDGPIMGGLDVDGLHVTGTPAAIAARGPFVGNRLRNITHHPGRLPVAPRQPCPCGSGSTFLRLLPEAVMTRPRTSTFDIDGPAEDNVFENVDSTADHLLAAKSASGNRSLAVWHHPSGDLRWWTIGGTVVAVLALIFAVLDKVL